MNFLKVSCLLIIFVLSSCSPLDVKNEQRFTDVVSIVISEDGVKYIKNRFSTFISQNLDTIPEETCGFASYIVDFDNQPVQVPPYRADSILWNKIDTSTFRYMSGSILKSYNDIFLSVALDLHLNQFIFFTVGQKVPEDYSYRYELLCNKDSVDKNGIITMYLKTKIDVPGVDTIPVNRKSLIAFNIRAFWDNQIAQGKDSIIFNLKYSSKIDSMGNPIYSSYGSKPIGFPITNK
ncbi:MAG: hypothetical protein LBI82_11125 [Dysgonamonadaceae bacterium]|jgi:hypothetical protein|nr:hypothetical protein [Dysgonamonadaceae bacterium]